MIKRNEQLSREVLQNRFGGKGEVSIVKLIEGEQFQGKGRLFAHNTLKPGCSIGRHQHNGDVEAYYILKGEGTVDDNGVMTTVRAGDVVFTGNGEFHGIENTGRENLEMIALVLFA